MDNTQLILSDITIFNKYAKYIPDLGRRETWDEIVLRNQSMHIKKFPALKDAITTVYTDYVLPKKVLPSMRSLQFAGKPIEINNARIFNCSYLPIDDYRAFSETCFLLLSGCGVGYSVQKHHVSKLPEIKQPIKTRKYLVADSIIGWADAVKELVKAYFFGERMPVFDFSDIRPKGALLITSGGQAPGPEPLKDMLHNIKKILDRKKIGDKLSTIECHDILCYIAQAVLAGGIRRSAMISLFNIDDESMLTSKFNHWWELNPQRALANNSAVILRHKIKSPDFKILWEKIEASRSGEPGIFFTNDKHYGTNPSLRAGTKILTKEGIYPIEELQDKEFLVKNLNNEWSKAKCFLSGKNKKLIKITLQNKFEYYATKEHEWPVDGKKVKSKDLKIGYELPINKNTELFDGTLGNYDDGFLYGWILGDGWFIDKTYNGNPQVGLIVSKKDHSLGIAKKLEKIIEEKTNCKSIFKIRKRVNNNGKKSEWYEINTQSKSLIDYLNQFGKPSKKLPLSKLIFEKSSENFRKGLIDGLFSSDGSFDLNSNKINFVAKHKQFIESIGELLGFYGIRFSFHKQTSSNVIFPNLKEYNKTYESYSLSIGDMNSIKHFFDIFNITKYDNFKFTKNIPKNPKISYKIIGVEETELKENVWDITVYDDTHCFQLSHCITGNCGEIALNATTNGGGFCNLTEINGSDITTQSEFNARATAAAFIGTLQASYTDFHYLREGWRELAEREALLGGSITGIANKNFLKLDFKEASDLTLQENARVSKLIGINKAYRINTVKPAGTTSLVLGCSSGIHAWYAKYYIRRMRLNKSEPLYKYLKRNIPELIEDDFLKPEYTAILSIPQTAPEGAILRDESPLDLLERVKKIKTEWIAPSHRKGSNMHNVSVTVNIKPDEWSKVGDWMWDNRDVYNGISVLPYDNGTYKQAPFEECSKEKFLELCVHLKKIDLTKVKEHTDFTDLQSELACSGGACEII